MPTYERRFYLDCFKDEMEAIKENNNKGGKGRRISGETLKNSIKSGQIPSQ